MSTNEIFTLERFSKEFNKFLGEVYDESFTIVLNHYTKSETGLDSFSTLILNDPIKAYNVLLTIFKVDLTIKVLFEILISKSYQDFVLAEKICELLMKSFRCGDGVNAKKILLDVLKSRISGVR
ncbi:MAG: hypothetical protein N3F64_03220 [Nitrososphaeria archaeon]|nr:hypothetical protein [Nitrososphaeria archaeon]